MGMRIVFAVVLLGFGGFSVWVTQETSYLGAFPPFSDWNTTQIFWDLGVASTIALYLLFRQRKARGRAVWPVLVCWVGVLLLGSISLLVLLVLDADVHRTQA